MRRLPRLPDLRGRILERWYRWIPAVSGAFVVIKEFT